MAAAHRSPVPDRLILLTTILFLPTIHHAHHYLHPMGAPLLRGILQKKIDSNSWPRSVVTLFNLSVYKVGMNAYLGLGMLRVTFWIRILMFKSLYKKEIKGGLFSEAMDGEYIFSQNIDNFFFFLLSTFPSLIFFFERYTRNKV